MTKPLLQPKSRPSRLLFKQLPTEYRILMFIITIATLLVAVSVGIIARAEQTWTAQSQVSRDAKVVRNLDDLFINLLNTETGQRGYVLTGNPAYLEPYTMSLPIIASDMKSLQSALPQTPENEAFLSKLQVAVSDKEEELSDAITLRKTKGFSAALKLVDSNYGKQQMDDLRSIIGPEITRYAKEIQLAQTAARRQFHSTLWFVGAGIILFLLFIALAYRQIRMDLYQKRQLLEQLEHQAGHDMLTGLPNRRYFMDFLEYSLLAARREGEKFALLFIDLDGFKHINDTLGHAAGDETLRLVANVFRRTKRDIDVLARLGGDEFAVLVPKIEVEENVMMLATRLLDAFRAHPDISSIAPELGASIGIACYPLHATTTDSLIEAADTAMYQAKSAGGQRAALYAPLTVEPGA